MRSIVVTAPEPVITVDEAAAHLNVDAVEDQEDLIKGMIAAATQHIDGPTGWLGRAIGAQVLETRFPVAACGSVIRLPYPPITSLVSIKYLDAAGAEQTADVDGFELFGGELFPLGWAWPWAGGSLRRDAVRIRYNAGYETIPDPIRAAILLMVGDLYRNRDSAPELSNAAMQLLSTFRIYA